MDAADQLFGKIALKNGFVTMEQHDECARVAKGSGKALGDVLLEKKLITDKIHRAISSKIQEKLAAEPKQTAVAEEEPAEKDEPEESEDESKDEPQEKKRPAQPLALAGTTAPKGGARLPPLKELLARAKKMGASDLHISIATRPFVRYHGVITPLEDLASTEPAETKARIYEILTPEQRARLEERLDLDTVLAIDGVGRFRTSVLMQRRGVAAVFRIVRDKVPALEDLGVPEIVKKFTTYHQGIVLVTGSTGSGKSSTLAALIEIINQTRKDHVITLEDPIEFVYECKKANITQRQIEAHTLSWGNALRASLREDPDVIMVGEMRDLETMRLAVTAAETGHLVLATLHTTNATRTIDRLLDVFPPKEQSQIRAMVSESLRGIISQQLIPRADGKGRVAACEILFSTPAVANLIREKRTFQLFSVLQTGRKLGMKLMDDALDDLVKAKTITKEQARFRALNPKRFEGK